MSFNDSKYNLSWSPEKISNMGIFARGVSKHRPRNDKRLFENGKYPLVQTSQVKNAILYLGSHEQEYSEFGLQQSKLWDTGTLCITIAANIAETAVIAYPMCFPDSVVGFTASPEKTTEEFVYYIFSSMRQMIQNSASGSTQDNINLDYLSRLEFRFPDKKEQDRIVKTLSCLDKKIINNLTTTSDLKNVIKLIYDYWFVQFDFPDQNGKPYKTSGGAMEWNSELKREIPCGWKVKKLSDLACKGKDCPYTSPQCVPTFDLSVMPSNNMLLANFNESKNFSTNLFVLKQGDILFGSIRPYLRKAGIAPCDGAVAGTVHVIRPRRKEDYNFLATTLCSERMFKYATTVSQGTKMPVVTIDSLFDYKIAYDETVAEKFNGFDIKGIFSRIAIENHELAALRDFLLPMLMNGQVKLKAESSESGASPTQSKSFKTKITEK